MTTFNIYRALTPMDIQSMPAPIATGVESTNYSDDSASVDQQYYYRVGALKNGLEKISEEILVSTNSLVDLAYIAGSARNAAASGAVTSQIIAIAPHVVGDIAIVVSRVSAVPTIPNFNLIYDSGLGIRIFAKILSTTSTTNTDVTVAMDFGALASFILRPSSTINNVSCEGTSIQYDLPAVANDTINRTLETLTHINTKGKIFEVDIAAWSNTYTTVYPVLSITTNQTLIASRTIPKQVASAFNFVLAGKNWIGETTLSGASFNVAKIPAGIQKISAVTAAIYAS